MSIFRHIGQVDEKTGRVGAFNADEHMTTEKAVAAGLSAEQFEIEQAYDSFWYKIEMLPSKPLEKAKEEKIETLKQARDENEQDYFVYDGHRYNSDSTSCQRITNTVMVASAMGEAFQMDWTDYENVEVPMNAQGMLGLQQALMQHSLACHTQYRDLKAKVNACKTVKKVNAIEWTWINDGWGENEEPAETEE